MSSDPSSNESAQESPRYSALCERAIAFVVQRGGAVPEDVLVGHVFGNAGSLDMWRPLLRNVLQADDRVTFRADGTWALRGSGAIDQLPGLLLAALFWSGAFLLFLFVYRRIFFTSRAGDPDG